MAQTVSDQIIQRLYTWGVRTIYGYPGDGINGLIGALDRSDGKIRFIQTRHEEIAAFMACAHAKFTGEVGVCMATSGPGAIHLLNGLYDAARIISRSSRSSVRPRPPRWAAAISKKSISLSLFKDVAHNYVHECMSPAAARHQIDRAMRIAVAERCVTAVIVPNDIQEMDAVEIPPHEHNMLASGIGYHRGIARAREATICAPPPRS